MSDTLKFTPRIVSARITEMPTNLFDPMPSVIVKYAGDETEQHLFDYYPDEISFTAAEFIGLTRHQALLLKCRRDADYIRS
jgi:hypothetical protein